MGTRMTGGYLTVYDGERTRILGELSDAAWLVEQADGNVNHILTGVASDGTYDEFLRLNAAGVDHLAFDFEGTEGVYTGSATLLRPESDGQPGGGMIRIESHTEPVLKDRPEKLI